MIDATTKRDAGFVLLLLYLGSFALFTLVGWFTGRAIDKATTANILLSHDVKAMREAVEGLNLKLGRYEQEYERRFVAIADGCQAIRTQLYESMMTPTEQFQADVVQRLQRLEATP